MGKRDNTARFESEKAEPEINKWILIKKIVNRKNHVHFRKTARDPPKYYREQILVEILLKFRLKFWYLLKTHNLFH